MAQIFVKNSLNPFKVVKVGVSFIKTRSIGIRSARSIWALEIGTNELDLEGKKIPPYYITNLNLERINNEIEKGVGYICSKIDWGALLEDIVPPKILNIKPKEYIVDMMNSVEFTLRDDSPSSGIDLSSLKVEVNGIDVSDELGVRGNPLEYNVIWHPKLKFFRKY